jgi:hypothetical protein
MLSKLTHPHLYRLGGFLFLPRTRTRPIPDWSSQFGTWSWKRWLDSTTKNGNTPVLLSDEGGARAGFDPNHLLFQGRETTTDENHGLRSRRDLFGNGPEDIGGSFFSQKKRCYAKDGMRIYHLDASGLGGSGNWNRIKYDGPILAIQPQDSLFPTFTGGNLLAKGTTAIAACKPTNNVADLATTVAETLREGLPHLIGMETWESRSKAAKDAGDEFLNYQFGWLPLVSDVRNASYAIANAHKIIEAYERNAGKSVRRRFEFPVEQTEQTELMFGYDGGALGGSTSIPEITSDLSKPLAPLYKTTKFYRKTWFSGAFMYHLPVDYRSRNWLKATNAKAGPLLGLDLTPETLWNIAPWTWAVDWFSNLGDIVSNISDWATDGLVMRYGYIMEHTLQEITYHIDGPTRRKPYGTVFATPLTFSLETKRRAKASPYGFGVDFSSFTSRQKAIVVALGLSRS